jgi:hypothetical protein
MCFKPKSQKNVPANNFHLKVLITIMAINCILHMDKKNTSTSIGVGIMGALGLALWQLL